MRRGDTQSHRNYFRSVARVFNLNGSWYFATRERDQGPFSNRELAEVEARRYADELLAFRGFQASREAERAAQSNRSQSLSILPLEEPSAGPALASD